MIPPPAPDVVDLVGPPDSWVPIGSGRSAVWESGRWIVTHGPGGGARRQAERLGWAASRLSVPDVALCSDDGDWLVTVRVDGHPAHRIDLHGDIQGIVGVLATAVRAVHDTPVDTDDFPFERGWGSLAASVESAVQQLDASTLPDPYRRYGADRLLEIWRDGRPAAATDDVPVLCHGGPTASDLIVQGASATWVDLDRLCLADRHLDLAAMHHSLHSAFGPEAVFVFYEAYGRDPDLVRLDHYRLAHLLQSGAR